MPPQPGIGRAEMDVLRYISDRHPVSVREVAEHLAATKGHTRTTALNIMERLREKGYLIRRKVEGVYVYSPAQTKGQLLQGVVRDFVQGMLGGSLEPFVAYLAEEGQVNEAELAELKELVRRLEEERGEDAP